MVKVRRQATVNWTLEGETHTKSIELELAEPLTLNDEREGYIAAAIAWWSVYNPGFEPDWETIRCEPEDFLNVHGIRPRMVQEGHTNAVDYVGKSKSGAYHVYGEPDAVSIVAVINLSNHE